MATGQVLLTELFKDKKRFVTTRLVNESFKPPIHLYGAIKGLFNATLSVAADITAAYLKSLEAAIAANKHTGYDKVKILLERLMGEKVLSKKEQLIHIRLTVGKEKVLADLPSKGKLSRKKVRKTWNRLLRTANKDIKIPDYNKTAHRQMKIAEKFNHTAKDVAWCKNVVMLVFSICF